MQTLGSISAVVAAIRDEAEQAEEAVERALAEELERIHREPLPTLDLPDRAARLSMARRRAREARSRQDWLDRRAALEERERWMARVLAEALRRLTDPSDPKRRLETLKRQIDEARHRLPGTEFEVRVPEADVALLTGELGDVFTVVCDPALPAGGCVVRTANGKVGYDNGLETRARRFEGVWRAALGEIFER